MTEFECNSLVFDVYLAGLASTRDNEGHTTSDASVKVGNAALRSEVALDFTCKSWNKLRKLPANDFEGAVLSDVKVSFVAADIEEQTFYIDLTTAPLLHLSQGGRPEKSECEDMR